VPTGYNWLQLPRRIKMTHDYKRWSARDLWNMYCELRLETFTDPVVTAMLAKIETQQAVFPRHETRIANLYNVHCIPEPKWFQRDDINKRAHGY